MLEASSSLRSWAESGRFILWLNKEKNRNDEKQSMGNLLVRKSQLMGSIQQARTENLPHSHLSPAWGSLSKSRPSIPLW